MAGYYGYKMSNNALAAYENGEMPLSKWTKKNIMEAIKECSPEHPLLKEIEKLPMALLKEKLLRYTAWHHTSSRYNETDFYSIDEITLEDLTKEELEEWKKEYVPTPRAKPSDIPRRYGIAEWREAVFYNMYTHKTKYATRDVSGWIECNNDWVVVYKNRTGKEKLLRKREWNVNISYLPEPKSVEE